MERRPGQAWRGELPGGPAWGLFASQTVAPPGKKEQGTSRWPADQALFTAGRSDSESGPLSTSQLALTHHSAPHWTHGEQNGSA